MPRSRDHKKGCPVCGNPGVGEDAPFCSPRCKDRDLLRWLGGGYSIPGPAADPGRVDSGDTDD